MLVGVTGRNNVELCINQTMQWNLSNNPVLLWCATIVTVGS